MPYIHNLGTGQARVHECRLHRVLYSICQAGGQAVLQRSKGGQALPGGGQIPGGQRSTEPASGKATSAEGSTIKKLSQQNIFSRIGTILHCFMDALSLLL